MVSRKIISEWVAGGCISGTLGTWSLVTTSCPASITPVSRGGALSVECRVLQSAGCPASRYIGRTLQIVTRAAMAEGRREHLLLHFC